MDDDGNGFIDDLFGYDFRNDDPDPRDDNFHGTHCAGIVGAVGDNGTGVAGVAWRARIMALKFLGMLGTGSDVDAAECIYYAINNDADLLSCSWSGPSDTKVLSDAMKAAEDAGILVVAAAGNDATDIDVLPEYPAAYPHANIISVANTIHDDTLRSDSNYGAESVDLAAPGDDILSTFPGNRYAWIGGTSMSAPAVAGAAALVWAQRPELTHYQVRELLFQSVDPLVALEGLCVTGGRLNAATALSVASTSPEKLLLGLGDSGAGWVETFQNSSSRYQHLGWRRFQWSGYNNNCGELRTAAGDLDGNGEDELILAVRSGGEGWVELVDGHSSGYLHGAWIRLAWSAYNSRNGEIFPCAGDLDGDGRDEVVLGTGSSGSGWVQIFDDALAGFAPLCWRRVDWSGYVQSATAEVRPATGDVDGDGLAELVLGLGSGAEGWFELVDDLSSGLTLVAWKKVQWSSYVSEDGATYPACGDLDGDGLEELVVGLQQAGEGWFEVFEDASLGMAHLFWGRLSWQAYNSSAGETRPACGDLDGDGAAELLLGLADGGQGYLQLFDYEKEALSSLGWIRTSWSQYNSGPDGESWPAVGKFD